MDIRLATTQDVEAVRALYEEFFAYSAAQQPQYYQSAAAAADYPEGAVKSESADLIVAAEQERILGFAHITEEHTPPFAVFVPHRFAHLIDLYVRPDCRKQGVGGKLLDAAAQWAKKRGLEYIELKVLFENENAVDFYEHLGYRKASHTMRMPL